MMGAVLRVGVVGCGLAGAKRAAALGDDQLVATFDSDPQRARTLAGQAGGRACGSLAELLELDLDVVIVSTSHDALVSATCEALRAGAHVLVEKPGARTVEELDEIGQAAQAAQRVVKVGFNHRFHPGIARAAEEASSGVHGELMFLRARYGHGGRPRYEHEWRARREIAGGGELLDQGMHVLDLCHWILGPLPLHSALLRTSYWDMDVEDNAMILLGDSRDRRARWATLHASWSEWKNEFALEIYCRMAKLQVLGLAGSYGPQTLRIYRMRPELGPPDLEEIAYPPGDSSWRDEWRSFRSAVAAGAQHEGLASARYALGIVAQAYQASEVVGERKPRVQRDEAAWRDLVIPPITGSLPGLEAGCWVYPENGRPFVSYIPPETLGWSEDLQALHDESPDHVIDRATREAVLTALGSLELRGQARIADVGCGSGRMLEDLAARFGHATLVGLDAVPPGLIRTHERVPGALLLLADVQKLPFIDCSLDVVVALNVLEHIAADEEALKEIRRVLKPGGTTILVVPFNDRLYDFYDSYLEHERRYARGELARKARASGFVVTRDTFIGCAAYPAFWVVKKWGRARHGAIPSRAKEALIRQRIASSNRSTLGEVITAFDNALLRAGVRAPFGIRELVAARAP